MHTFEHASLLALPMIGSDHTPLMLNTSPSQDKRGVNFRFEATWAEHDECEGEVRAGWEEETEGSSLFRVAYKEETIESKREN